MEWMFSGSEGGVNAHHISLLYCLSCLLAERLDWI